MAIPDRSAHPGQLCRDVSPGADSGWNADRKADGEQQQHFFHHEPDDTARLRAERQPDAELFLAAHDDEGHDAVEADRREERRKQSEAGRQQRDQVIAEKRLVELRLESLHLIDRHRGVELLHLAADHVYQAAELVSVRT